MNLLGKKMIKLYGDFYLNYISAISEPLIESKHSTLFVS